MIDGKKTNDFEKSLEFGRIIEKNYLDNFILPTHEKAQQVPEEWGKFSDYDLFCSDEDCMVWHSPKDEPTTWEIKSDQKSHFSGNYCFEFMWNKKPSGLAVTKADFWVIYDGDYHSIPVIELKNFFNELKTREYPPIRVAKGGDDDLSHLVIVPKNVFFTNPFVITRPFAEQAPLFVDLKK